MWGYHNFLHETGTKCNSEVFTFYSDVYLYCIHVINTLYLYYKTMKEHHNKIAIIYGLMKC